MQYNAPNSNPYDQSTIDEAPETPPFDEILRSFVADQLTGLRVAYPAKITKVKGDQKVDVQPLLKSRMIDGTTKDVPQVLNCLVSMPQGAGYSIKLPIAVGDVGWCLVSDRSLDAYAYSDGSTTIDPQDSRAHDMADSVFIPGGVPFPLQTQDSTTDLVVTNGKAVAKFQAGGTFAFTNGSNELMKILDQVLTQLVTLNDALSKDTVNTIFGPMQLNNFSTYANIKSELSTLQTKLETLKGS